MNFYQKFSLGKYSFSFRFTTNKVFSVQFLATKKPDKVTYGMTSRCKDGKHVIFLDYDGLTKEEVFEEISFLQGYFELGNFYIFQNDSEESFHAICLDKFPLYEAIEIVSQTSADRGFKKAPLYFKKRRWVLRVAKKGERNKPVYLDVIRSKFDELKESSTAHRLFMNSNYNLKIPSKILEDCFDEDVEFCEYNTASKC